MNVKLMHQYAMEKIYKILMWDMLGEKIESYDERPYPFYCMLDKNNMDVNKCFLVHEKLTDAMSNDILLNCHITRQGQCEITELMMFGEFKKEYPEMTPYILCGEYNYDISFFSKMALINVKEFCLACSSGLIQIDTSFTKKSSYIKDDVLYGVAKKSTNNETFVTFDIGYLSKISNKIIEYQYGFMTAQQRDNRFFASAESVENVSKLSRQNGILPSKDISFLSAKEANTLLGFFNSDVCKNEGVQQVIQNRALIGLLYKYFG